MAVRTDCINWNSRFNYCNALVKGKYSGDSICDIFDKDCPFFKTVKEQMEIEERCKWRCIRKGYEWQGRLIK